MVYNHVTFYRIPAFGSGEFNTQMVIFFTISTFFLALDLMNWFAFSFASPCEKASTIISEKLWYFSLVWAYLLCLCLENSRIDKKNYCNTLVFWYQQRHDKAISSRLWFKAKRSVTMYSF